MLVAFKLLYKISIISAKLLPRRLIQLKELAFSNDFGILYLYKIVYFFSEIMKQFTFEINLTEIETSVIIVVNTEYDLLRTQCS